MDSPVVAYETYIVIKRFFTIPQKETFANAAYLLRRHCLIKMNCGKIYTIGILVNFIWWAVLIRHLSSRPVSIPWGYLRLLIAPKAKFCYMEANFLNLARITQNTRQLKLHVPLTRLFENLTAEKSNETGENEMEI